MGDFAQTSHVLSVRSLAPITYMQDPNFSGFFYPPSPRQCWICVASALSRVYHSSGYSGPPHTCAAPRSPQECARACNRLCGGYWVVRLTETSQPHSALDAEWSSAWGGSPNRGRCQIPTVAPRNHSHTDADIGRRGGWGGRCGGSGCSWSVECESWAQRRNISLVFTVSCWPESVI